MSYWYDVDAVRALRGAVHRGDGSVVDIVRGRLTDDVLQLAGDGLVEAVAQSVVGAPDQAQECAALLRSRRWAGDEELADQLEASIGRRAVSTLRPLPVDLEELAMLLEGSHPMGGRIDVQTGECRPRFEDDDEDDEDDEDRWLYVEPTGSHSGYRDLVAFIGTVTDPVIADRLEIAINGSGAFRRFKDVLSRWPPEMQRYHLFADERQRGRSRAWLASVGFERVAPPPRTPDCHP